MAQAKRQVELNNFSGGFNTEQSPLNADPSTTIQESNLILASDGSRARRYGHVFKDSVPGVSITNANSGDYSLEQHVFHFNRVKSRNNSTDNIFYNYDYTLLTGNSNSTSFLDIAVLRNDETGAGGSLISSTSVNAKNMHEIPHAQWGSYFYLGESDGRVASYGAADTPFGIVRNIGSSEIYIRDLQGIKDGLDVTERPNFLDEKHAYNLLNQGWSVDAIVKFFNEVGLYPSNADAPYYGLVPDDNSTANPPPRLYDTELLKTYPFPSGAPKGNYYIKVHDTASRRANHTNDAFADINSQLGLSLDTINLLLTNPIEWNINGIAGFLGRLFYTGRIVGEDSRSDYSSGDDAAPSPANLLAFSRTLETSIERGTDADFNQVEDLATPWRCASTFNPTQETFTPSPTDGGYILIDDAEELLGCFSMRDSLIVVATNGCWELRARDGISPSTFVLSKVLSARISTTKGVVVHNSAMYIATDEGIEVLYYNADARRTVSQSLTDKSIATFFLKHRKWIVDGTYDVAANDIRWLLRTPPVYTNGTDLVTIEQKELVLDLTLGSFSVRDYPSCTAIVSINERGLNDTNVPYYAIDRDNQQGTGKFLIAYYSLPESVELGERATPIDRKRNAYSVGFYYFDFSISDLQLSEPEKGTFADFGVSTSAFMVTNPMTLGDTIRRKDINYLWTHFYRTEDGFEDDGSGDWIPTNPSGALLSVRWDFSDDAISGKWTDPKQVYRLQRDYLPEDLSDPFNYGHNIITTKNQVTGAGKALSVKLESDGDKDMQIIGWGTELGIVGAI